MNPPLTAAGVAPAIADDTSFFGHPRGLSTLFFTEMWERFSYYGMRAFLILYMTAPAAAGGLGYGRCRRHVDLRHLHGSAWGASIVGGLIADRLLGQYRSVLIGGILIMLGHFALAFPPLPFFYAGLALIVIGTGLLKPNVSTLVGSLYPPGRRAARRRLLDLLHGHQRRRAARAARRRLSGAARRLAHRASRAAGVGMALGLIQYVVGRRYLQAAVDRLAAQDALPAAARPATPAPRRSRRGGALGFDRRRVEARSPPSPCSSCSRILFWPATSRRARR